MSKIEEIITTNIDTLHNNYKSNNLSYKKFIDFFDKIGKLYLNFSDSIDSFFNKNISIIENQPISLHPLLLNTENIIKEQARLYYNFSNTINMNIIDQYKLLKKTNDEIESTAYKELKDYYLDNKKTIFNIYKKYNYSSRIKWMKNEKFGVNLLVKLLLISNWLHLDSAFLKIISLKNYKRN